VPPPRRPAGHASSEATVTDLPPLPDSLTTSTATTLPDGPALLYVDQQGTTTVVDLTAPDDRRERRILRSLIAHALELCSEADEADKTRARLPVGFQPDLPH
jgi:hypothetical protein